MSRRIRVLAPLALAAALAGLSGGVALGDAPADPGRDFGLSHRPVCPPAGPQAARCHADVVTGAAGEPHATTSYTSGYKPSDLVDAYNLEPGGSGQTVAIVDAYDNPNAEADLAVYRERFGLGSCTTANLCFRKIDQRGGSAYPRGDVGWGQEIALDLDMASAVCPGCKILLVVADSNSFADLAAAVDRAAMKEGATVISNSYGAPEFRGETSWESHYNHPGVAITVSSGDSGYGVEFPAASQYVTAVGGTRLTSSPAGEWSETVWSSAGSGCSAYVAKPSWQADRLTCPRRTVADVAAVADPATGVAVYDSYGATGEANWSVFGGTSVAAPIIAGVYALAGNTFPVVYASDPYHATTGALFDVTSGSNGRCSNRRTASLAYLCTGGLGYDGPTGLGTPNGIGAF